MNIVVIGLISSIVSVILLLLSNKLLKKENDVKDVIQIGIIGLITGFINYLLLNSSNAIFSKLLSDFDTGNPNF